MVLEQAADIDVIAEADSGTSAIELASSHRIDVALIDVQMPGLDGLDTVQRLNTVVPATRTIVLTIFGQRSYVSRVLACGADGFLLKDTGPVELITAVRAVAAGQAILSPRVTRDVLDDLNREASRAVAAKACVAGLTDRERDVLRWVRRGLSNGEVARQLRLSEGTVKTHMRSILATLGCANRVQAAMLARDAGL